MKFRIVTNAYGQPELEVTVTKRFDLTEEKPGVYSVEDGLNIDGTDINLVITDGKKRPRVTHLCNSIEPYDVDDDNVRVDPER